MTSILRGVRLVVPAVLLMASGAFAQGGGASTTGTIMGRVTDTSGGVLPGVTVSIQSPALIGAQTTTTNEQGIYRFPAVPPGVYTITYELAGFNTLRREGIQVALGFTATVNVELAVAALQETVTVTGESPVVDTSATRIQQNFKLDQLQSLPNARDMWSLLAVTPGVVMSRIDVGGNRAGTQTGYQAYGYSGQVRVLVEGINTTEGTGGAGFYFDYGSFEEVFLGTAGNSAEMPHPGVMSQFLGKSGGNNFQGEIYFDYENNAMQGSNIPQRILDWGIRPHSNEIDRYRDFNLNLGGPIKRDKAWWYFSYRNQFNAVAQPNFRFNKTFDTTLWNPSGKGTYQLNQNHKFIGYYQWGQKIQPNRLPFGAYFYNTPDDTWRQDSGSWVWKGEWNGTLTNNLYVEARYGDFGYYFPLFANIDPRNTYYWRDTGLLELSGGDRRWQLDRDRKQLTGAASYFKDGWLGGSHSFKFGGEVLLETGWEGYLQRRDGHVEHIFNNGRAQSVVFDFPTARRVNALGAGKSGDLLSVAKLDHVNAFLSDQWSLGRLTLNLGVRWDRYRSWVPEQEQMAFEIFPGCAQRTDIICAVPAQTFPEQTFIIWNSVVPRIGLVLDLMGDGKTVLKANYGLFRHNPGIGLASSANQNQPSKTVTYTWTDLNGDRRFQIGEQGALTGTALAGTITVDPNLKQPLSHELSVFVERELMRDVGARVGFVYKTNDDLWGASIIATRPHSAYTQPFTRTEIGRDGIAGTADDRVVTLYGIPVALAAQFPVTNRIMNLPEFARYRTIEAQINKRTSGGWSLTAGGSFTWRHDFPDGYPSNPNGLFDAKYTRWDFKVSGTYEGPWGLRFSPVFRHQAGPVYGRTATISSSNPIMGSTTVYFEPYGTFRQENINVLDVRTEKVVPLRGTARVRLFLDVFNILNQYAAETIGTATGPNFQRPTNILAPRVARVGFRFIW